MVVECGLCGDEILVAFRAAVDVSTSGCVVVVRSRGGASGSDAVCLVATVVGVFKDVAMSVTIIFVVREAAGSACGSGSAGAFGSDLGTEVGDGFVFQCELAN